MVTPAAPWSHDEMSLLLRAWADVVSENQLTRVYRTIFLRFQALCSDARASDADGGEGDDDAPTRAEPSVHNRRKSMENMHAVISLFFASIAAMSGHEGDNTATPPQESSRGDTSYYLSNDKVRAWFAMPESKRRRWFAAHNKKSYGYTVITQEHFEMITEIRTITNGGVLPPPPVYVKPEAKFEVAPKLKAKRRTKGKQSRISIEATLSEQELIAAMVRASESFRIIMERFMSKNFSDTTSTKDGDDPVAAAVEGAEEEPQQKPTVVPTPAPPQRSSPEIEESGSDTESDGDWEEIVPRSPIREAVVEGGAIAVAKHERASPLSPEKTSSSVSSTGNESQKRKLSQTLDVYSAESATYTDKRSRPAQPEILDLLNALEKQTRTLREAFRSTTLARRRGQVERQQILQTMRQEQNEREQLLESLRRQEEGVRQQRAAWRREKEEFRREYAELDDDH